ncbi:MAG: AMP-binding protein [Acidobacteria bacterium]|nr:AMP-binding protein [Acidobacteriota bacterium]MCI0624275.1 AMP-binding protein [Acidobacteriota bacterium]MCI0719584.1 AMP-binding protein [Acidobacteriota bacterium]
MTKHQAPDLSSYSSLGEALRVALDRWEAHLCLIEADRDRENARLSYADFKRAALPIARELQSSGFAANNRAAIIMSNQSKWLIAAYAIFHSGGVLVPIDFKLTAAEHLQLLAHAGVKLLVVEYPLWRALTQSPGFSSFSVGHALVTEAPKNANLHGARRWEECNDAAEPRFVQRRRDDLACIVYSSGTGGRPKGCMLTHNNYLEQCQSLMAWYPFWPGVRYLSILPTNHAIDFMVGFIGPFVCGATVVHLRTLRPEYLKDAFPRFKITYAGVVPMVLKAIEAGLKTRFSELPPFRGWFLDRLISANRWLTRREPRPALSRRLFPQIHQAFGGELLTLITGGAFAEPAMLQFFYDLGIPVANGYGLTEAGTAVTVNDLRPFRAETVGKPLPGVELRILDANTDGIGQVAVRSPTVMRGYLNDLEQTAEVLVNGWLLTGDLGRVDPSGHLHLFGRLRNMIVTEGGKNIYPEDIEAAFAGLLVKEYCVFAVNYVWKQRSLRGERLMIVLRLDPGGEMTDGLMEDLRARNRSLADFKRLSGYVLWEQDFPRTASMKIKRNVLAGQIAAQLARETALREL